MEGEFGFSTRVDPGMPGSEIGRGGEITPYIPVLRRSAAALAQALGRSNLFPTNLSNPDFVPIPALFQLQKSLPDL
jgi:hypothetical protein